MTAKVPTWKEIKDPNFRLPDEIEVGRSPIKLLLHFVFAQSLFTAGIVLFGWAIIEIILSNPKGLRMLFVTTFFFVLFSPIWGIFLWMAYRYLVCRGPGFVLRRDGLYMGFIDGGYVVPWSQITVIDYSGRNEIMYMLLKIRVDPNEVSRVPPLGRFGMHRKLQEGLKERKLLIPLIYSIGARKFKILMRAYQYEAEQGTEGVYLLEPELPYLIHI